MAQLISTNPAKGYEVIGSIEISTEQAIQEAVSLANQAKDQWRQTPLTARIKLVNQIHTQLENHKKEIARLITMEVGKTISNSRKEVEGYLSYVKWCLNNAQRSIEPQILEETEDAIFQVEYEPWGAVAVISPWNFPFGMAMWGIIPNLLVGNCVIFKASEECPLVGKYLEDIFSQINFLNGVMQFVHGDGMVGDILTDQDIDMIWFTGSTKTGKYLYKKAGKKFIPALMELGGSSPVIALEDVDVESAVETIFTTRFYHCGQVCSAAKRAIVHESIFDRVVEGLKKKVDEVKVGDPLDKSVDMGPLTAKRQLELAQAQIEDAQEKEARIYHGPSVGDLDGAYISPTIITDITSNMQVWHEETFAPILPIVAFGDEIEAIQLANDTNFGLSAQVLTSDSERGLRIARAIDAGSLKVGERSLFSHEMPFGGYKNSGMGREHGIIGMRQLCQVKGISLSK